MFVHPRLFVLAVDVLAIVQIGFIVERLTGGAAFAAVYFAAGIFSGLQTLSSTPLAVTASASGAVFGLYGLLIACIVVALRRTSSSTIPRVVLARFAPIGAMFLVSGVWNQGFWAGMAGLATGLPFGLVVVRDLDDRMPSFRRTAGMLAANLAVACVIAAGLRGITDVRPELERLVAMEHRTAELYKTASAKFAKGKMAVDELADLIERSIVPELKAADERIRALKGVPRESEPDVAAAREYLQLRSESWRLRAKGLRDAAGLVSLPGMAPESETAFRERAEAHYQGAMRTLGKAEGDEHQSLDALNRLPQR
jgi:rhomboid protease GluP